MPAVTAAGYRPAVVLREIARMVDLSEASLLRQLDRRTSRARLVLYAVACLWSSGSEAARVFGRSVSVVCAARKRVRALRETDPFVARLWARCMTIFTR